jgi:hypothetical protein
MATVECTAIKLQDPSFLRFIEQRRPPKRLNHRRDGHFVAFRSVVE